jgi:type IV secretory pathway VirB10-like protein
VADRMQRQEPIEAASASGLRAAWGQPHRRPVLICATLLFVVAVVASVFMVMPTKAAPRRERGAAGPIRLAPSLHSAETLMDDPPALVDAGVAERDGDATVAEQIVIPPEGMPSKPSLQNGPKVPSSPAASVDRRSARNEPTFEERQRKQYDEFLLAMQQERLKMRLDSLKMGTLVESFDRVRRAEAEEVSAMFGGGPFDSNGEAGGGGTLGDVSKVAGTAMQAMRAMGMGAPPSRGGFQGSAAGSGAAQADALLGLAGRGGSASGDAEEDRVRYQEQVDFFQNGGSQLPSGELAAKMKDARPYTLLMGHEIECLLVTKTISEAPGMLRGVVTKSVYDRYRNLLIPQGTETVGTYSARIAQGNARLQVAWTRLNFPDGRSLDLGSMPGASEDGAAGIEDQVDRHVGKRIGAVLMSSAFTAAYELSIPDTGNLLGSAVSNSVGQNVTNFGVDLAREMARQQPTITLRQGKEFLILLNKDVTFEAAYDDGVERTTVRAPSP